MTGNQLTIPAAIRRKLNLKPGDPVRFGENKRGVYLERDPQKYSEASVKRMTSNQQNI